MSAAAGGKHVFFPKALLVRNMTENDEWIENISRKISEELREKHIAVTSDMNEIDTAHMIIVFLNATFLVNCHHLLEYLVGYAFDKQLLLTAVVYENNDDSKLLSEIFMIIDGNFPQDFDFNTEDEAVKQKLTKLILLFFNRTNTMFCDLPYSSNDKNIIEGILRPFINRLVSDLNPLHIDISKIPLEFMHEVLNVNKKIDDLLNVGNYEPLLALFKFQPCLAHDCSSQMMTTIIQLLYTYNNIFKQRDIHALRLYVSMPPIKNGEEPPSFATVFRSAFEARYPERTEIYSFEPLFLVIDDFQKFVPEGVDPKYLLARILEQLGVKSYVITSIPNFLKVDKIDPGYCSDCFDLGPVQGTLQCIHSPLNTIQEPWPRCYIIFGPELGKLAMEDFVMDDADSDEAEEGQTEKNVHSTNFDVTGNAEKKLREA